MIMEMIVFILMHKYDFLNQNDKKNKKDNKNKRENNVKNQYREELNGYLAIDKNISNEVTSENGYMEISLDTNSLIRPNKNIWKGVKNTDVKNQKRYNKIDSNIKFKLKSETLTNSSVVESEITTRLNSESFEIEESEICFDNLIG